jgi:hypothetical protein
MAKKIGVAVLVVALVIGLALAILWKRLTALPEWADHPDMIAEDGTPQVDPDWVRIPAGEPQAGGYVIRNPHLRAEPNDGAGTRGDPAKRQRKPAPLRKAIKQSRASYRAGAVEAGAIINLSEMDLEQLAPDERARYQQTIDAFPALTGRNVYVGIEGGIEDHGKLSLGRDSKLRVGDTRYSLKTAAKRLGMSEAELRATINKELSRVDTPPQDG